jgi:hypothetical protein
MTEVIKFPGLARKDLSDWSDVEPIVRKGLTAAGAPAAMIDWVCEDLRPRYAAMQQPAPPFDFYVTPEVAEEISKLINFFQEGVLSALGEMVILEMNLFCALYGGAPPKLPLPLAA